jgi:SSS family solute:Na+ symporter
MATGTALALARDLKSSVYPFQFGSHVIAVYAAIPALLVNLLVSAGVTVLMNAMGREHLPDQTVPADYLPAEG